MIHGAIRGVREALENAAMIGRLTRDLPFYLRRPRDPRPASERVRRELEARPERLIALAEQLIYRQPKSPYLALLRHSGCELGDLATLVRTEGVDHALEHLASQGVYVTFDEAKGRRPIRRGSLSLSVEPSAFDNPTVRAQLPSQTSGSGGRPIRVPHSLDSMDDLVGDFALAETANGIDDSWFVSWWPSAVNQLILAAAANRRTPAWFYPVHPLPVAIWIMAAHLKFMGALAGRQLPLPRRCDLNNPEPLLAWSWSRPSDQWVTIHTMPSAATRLAMAAVEAGRKLDRVVFLVVGEPLTEARRAHILASGATVIPYFGTVEYYCIAAACPSATTVDDMHVHTNRYAIIQRQRPAVEAGPVVDALLITTLSPRSAKIALNVELGDHATLQTRDCDCPFGQLGLRTRLSDIRSFEKMTGEGVTFARSRIEQIIEQVLPARFGGTSLDYQLSEEEAPNSMTRLVLCAHPRLGPLDEGSLRRALLTELAREGLGASHHAAIWERAGTVEVRREAPRATRAGKVLPFQASRSEPR